MMNSSIPGEKRKFWRRGYDHVRMPEMEIWRLWWLIVNLNLSRLRYMRAEYTSRSVYKVRRED